MARLSKQEIGFTQIKNEVLNDKRLSWKAKGLFGYLFSKPDGWEFSGHRISEDSKDGEKATYAGLKELENYGYLRREKKPDGKVIYALQYEKPDSQKGDQAKKALKPNVQNSYQPKRQIAETGTISNKEIKKQRKEKNTYSTNAVNALENTQEIPELIDLFKTINPSYTNFFKINAQRNAIERLIKAHGYKKIHEVISSLPKIIYKKYAPRITTPLQLENKLADLVAFVRQNQQDKAVVAPAFQKNEDI